MNLVKKSVMRINLVSQSNSLTGGEGSFPSRSFRALLLASTVSLIGACTSLPGPPLDPGKHKQTRVDGPGNLSKVAYGKAETPRNLPKSAWGNAPTYKVFGKQYSVMDSSRGFREEGIASWYGSKFHGRQTSNGDVYNMYDMTAAHKHLPLPTFVRVTNLENNKQLVVKVNDRGPFVDDRIIDLSYGAAAHLGVLDKGTARVSIVAISENIEKPATLVADTKTQTRTPKPAEAAPVAQAAQAAQPQYVEILASGHDGRKSILAGSEVVRKPVAVPRRETALAQGQALPPVESVVKPAATVRQAVPGVIDTGTVIQVGAFANPGNAESMRQRVNLAVNGDAAIIIPNATGTLLKVQIGPLSADAPVDIIVGQLRKAGLADIKLFEL